MKKETDDNTAYCISPKGWMMVRLGLTMEEVDAFWRLFTKFVADKAKQNDAGTGVPCLVFKDGGYCITVKQLVKNIPAK